MCHLESKYIIQTHFENVQIYTSEKFTTILCMCVSFDNIIFLKIVVFQSCHVYYDKDV